MTVPVLPIAAALAVLAGACSSSVETATPPSASYEPSKVPSCVGDPQCGSPAQSCCVSPVVEGGTFDRYNNPKWPATVSSFRLDAFEVTVGRLRAFVEAYPGSRPKEGDGAHPKLASSGWRSEWDEELPETQEALRLSLVTPLAYDPPLEYDVERLFTWSDTPVNHEQSAANNVTWYLAFAFCAWDEGRLPTEAEWSYVLVGGDEQRPHPWGDEPPGATRAVLLDKDDTYDSWLLEVFISVGSRPAGSGRFGQLDLGGSRFGWAFDAVDPVDSPNRGYILPCVDCMQLETAIATYRVYTDPPFAPDDDRSNQYSWVARPDHHDVGAGIRCARDLP